MKSGGVGFALHSNAARGERPLRLVVTLSNALVLDHTPALLPGSSSRGGLGACTYDVCPEGEGGGWLNSDQRRGGCVDLVLTRGGRGSKIPKIWLTSFVNGPLD